jgi:hypothetical protein
MTEQVKAIDDTTISRLAVEAGLCISECSGIDLYLDTEARKDDVVWFESSSSVQERQRRQDILNSSDIRAQQTLQKLKRFAELISDTLKAAESFHEPASDETLQRIRSSTKRYKLTLSISTNDSCIDNRLGTAIWSALDKENEILERMSIPEPVPQSSYLN